MIKTLAHTCLLSQDLAKTEAFYCGALGLTKKFEFEKEGELFGFYLQIDESRFLEFFRTDPMAPASNSRILHLCFETDDIDAVREKLQAKGVEVTEKRFGPDNSWQCWCKDPDGVDLEFHQYTEKSSQYTGATCIVDW